MSAVLPAEASLGSLIDIEATFLPVGQMRQITRVTHCDGPSIVGEVDLTHHWVFPQHFPADPIFPGCLMIEAAGQLVALWAWAQGQRGRPRLVRTSAEFKCPVGPQHERLVLTAEVKRKRHLCFGNVQLWTGKAGETPSTLDVAATVEVVLAVLG